MVETPQTIRVVLADDHPIVRAGIRHELQSSGIEVLGEAADGIQALQLVNQLKPDLLILDVEMPELNGLEVTRKLRESQPQLPILVLSAYDHEGYIEGLLEAGARGYVLKDEALETIVHAVYAAVEGRTWLSPRVATKLVNRMAHPKAREDELSLRESEVLQLLALGYNNAQIAQKLFISEGTVRNHVNSIYSKLNLRTRAEVVAWAWEHKLVFKR